MRKYGFFGGAFNPPTKAHIEYAKKAKEQMKLDKVFFVPVGDTYNKKGLIKEEYRYQMLEQICKKINGLEVSDIELNQKKELKAIDVFKKINQEYQSADIYFIMGADNFIHMQEWKNGKELITNYKYIILEREKSNLQNIIKENVLLFKNRQNFNIINQDLPYSSTKIREAIKKNESISDMTYKEVEKFILKKGLYQNN